MRRNPAFFLITFGDCYIKISIWSFDSYDVAMRAEQQQKQHRGTPYTPLHCCSVELTISENLYFQKSHYVRLLILIF